MAATGKVIGTVTAVVGEAKATATDGTVRVLQVGDQVHSDEVITTSAAGSINVALTNGKTLDCGSDADLALHQGLLDVGVTAAPSSNTDIDSIQRAIAAGQDPSQVAAATAAGGAPAAGGADEGGAHSPVIVEQGNAASVVSSGFSTEGDTIAFEAPLTEQFAGRVVNSSSAPVVVTVDNEHAPVTPAFDNSFHASLPPVVEVPQAEAPAVVAEPPVTVVVDTPAQTNNEQAPIVVVQPNEPVDEQPSSDEPIVVAQPNEPTDEQPTSDEPIIVAQPNEPTDEQPTGDEPVIVVQPNEPGDDQPTGDDPIVVVDEETPAVVETPAFEPGTVSLNYSISANTNQDEQIGRLIFENGEHKYSTLVFFGQEGQQSPTAVELQFDLTEGSSTVKLQYIDAFAGNDDASTGKMATKIAIKDFGLGVDGEQILLAEQNDGVNIGVGNKNLMTEGSVNVDMTTGQAGDWDFHPMSASPAVDILDLTGSTLAVGNITAGTEVVNMKGSAEQELTLNAADVLNVTEGANILHIVGGKEDTLNVTGPGWSVVDGDASAAGTQASHFGWVQVNNQTSGATLLVDPDVNVHLMG